MGTTANEYDCIMPCGYIASPLYPHHYANNLDIIWNITVEEGHYIELVFQPNTIDLESRRRPCEEDYLMIYDVTYDLDLKLIARRCNAKKDWKNVFFSSWNRLKLQMRSDDDIAATGFFAKYYSRTFQIPESMEKDIEFDGNIKCLIGIIMNYSFMLLPS